MNIYDSVCDNCGFYDSVKNICLRDIEYILKKQGCIIDSHNSFVYLKSIRENPEVFDFNFGNRG